MSPSVKRCVGVSLVEITIAMVIFGAGMGSILAGIERGTEFSQSALTATLNDANARKPLQALTDVVSETSIAYVDTSMRIYTRATNSIFESDRFPMPNMGLRQCTSPTCRFHTRSDLSLVSRAYNCGYEYRVGLGLVPQVRGKNWPSELDACPLDGSPLMDVPMLDGLKFFSARGPDGSFSMSTAAIPEASWNNLILVFPFLGSAGTVELRLYQVCISDLLAAGATFGPAWERWDPNAPSMIDLFDFGTDGTADGDPDGSVPVTAAASDGDVEVFMVADVQGETSIVYTKVLGTPGSFPYRRVAVTVALKDGTTSFSVLHRESATAWWSAATEVVRAPRILLTHLTDFAASTAASSPHDAQGNPTGVRDAGLVRISLATTQRLQQKGTIIWPYRVDRLTLRPRN